MLKHLIELRDFSFVMLKKQNGEAYAEQWYKFQVMVFCAFYNFAFCSLIIVLILKAGIALPSIMYSGNFFIKFFLGSLMFVPYIILFIFLFRKMSKYPIDKDMSSEKYTLLRRKAILTVFISIALFVLIPWSLNRFLPPFH